MPSRPSKPQPCRHQTLTYLCSPHFGYTEYKPPSVPELGAAARFRKTGVSKIGVCNVTEAELPNGHSWAFPAPLILPGDALEDGPDEGIQSYAEWSTEPARKAVTKARRTIYVCAPPRISHEVDEAHGVRSWAEPKPVSSKIAQVQRPEVDVIREYLSAFYHGLPVKLLEADLRFVCWDEEPRRRAKPATGRSAPGDATLHIGLAAGDECVRIRTRQLSNSPFERQLNLNDILDVACIILPKDAYAIVMLVDHDIYEGDDDDFCCGRAYGGSRISVVSSARYNPGLDESEGLDYSHAWPASHCLDFVLGQCEAAGCGHHTAATTKLKSNKRGAEPTCDLLRTQPSDSPLHQAVSALKVHRVRNKAAGMRELWTSRVCKTASHELGHCFGISHCVFYACIMQSTSGAAEDAEQPPYLCPVDQRKVLTATGSGLRESYEAMQAFCASRGEGQLWAALRSWLEARLREVRQPAVIDLTSSQ